MAWQDLVVRAEGAACSRSHLLGKRDVQVGTNCCTWHWMAALPVHPLNCKSEGQTVAGDNRLSQPTGSMTHNPLRSRHLFN